MINMTMYDEKFEQALKMFGYTYQEYLKLTEEEIKKKYRKESFKYHPDRYPDDEEKAKKQKNAPSTYKKIYK